MSYMECSAVRRVTAREANQQFSSLLARASGGEEIVITRHGEPVATLAPYRRAADERSEAVDQLVEWMRDAPKHGTARRFTRDELHE